MGREQRTPYLPTRRGFLHSAVGVGTGITAASFAGLFGIGTPAEAARKPAQDVGSIINLAATAETLAVTFYYTSITGATFHIDAPAVEYLKLAMDAEMHHLQILESLGGTALEQQFYMPDRLLSDASVFVNTGLMLEAALTGAYLAATHQLALLGQPLLAATVAQHAASEAQHSTLLRHLAGLPPNDLTLPAVTSYQMSDALPALTPFLSGRIGFTGPVPFPSARKYQAALGDTRAERVPAFVQAVGASRS